MTCFQRETLLKEKCSKEKNNFLYYGALPRNDDGHFERVERGTQ